MTGAFSWPRRWLLAALGGKIVMASGFAHAAADRADSPKSGTLSTSPSQPQVSTDEIGDPVQIRNGQFVQGQRPFVIRGTNYFGSWRDHQTIIQADGIEQHTAWDFYHTWDEDSISADFRTIREQLNATAIRTGTPSKADFDPLVQFHGYEPWFESNGSITEQYKTKLVRLADIARAHAIRIQFCLLWNVGGEIAKNRTAFRNGGALDKFYSNNVRSIAAALNNHPGVLGYSVGNEVLVNWPINGTQKSWFESLAAGFVVRRLQEIREAAPRQLITTDEGASPGPHQWYAPGITFKTLADVDDGRGVRSVRLADMVDYLGGHFYPETAAPEDLTDGFRSKIRDAEERLSEYLSAAKQVGKPAVLNEFGLPMSRKRLAPRDYAAVRDRFYTAIVEAGEKLGLQGLLAWNALPEFTLRPGGYTVTGSTVNQYSPTELDIHTADRKKRRILFYDPAYNLFNWTTDGTLPRATAAAKAIASAWPHVRSR